MKYGTLYSYWSHEWVCDYPAVAKKVRAAGCDILEVGAPHIAAMTDAQLAELKASAPAGSMPSFGAQHCMSNSSLPTARR